MLRYDRGGLEKLANIGLQTRTIGGVPEGFAADEKKARERECHTKQSR